MPSFISTVDTNGAHLRIALEGWSKLPPEPAGFAPFSLSLSLSLSLSFLSFFLSSFLSFSFSFSSFSCIYSFFYFSFSFSSSFFFFFSFTSSSFSSFPSFFSSSSSSSFARVVDFFLVIFPVSNLFRHGIRYRLVTAATTPQRRKASIREEIDSTASHLLS